MIVVFAMMATLWGVGMIMGAPHRVRWVMIAILLAGVMLVQLILPDGHPLREATGGSPQLWALLAGFGGIVAVYARGLAWLKRRALPAPKPQTGTFSEAELNRYARHMILRDIGGPGQKALKQARVLVVGAGGLGSPVLLYLAGAGVGTIGVVDDDDVDASNLQRQVIHRDAAIGTPKVFSAQKAMLALNPHITVRPYHRRLTEDWATDLFADYDVILDGTDGFVERDMINRAAVAAEKPLIAAAISPWEGQISLYDPAHGAPCYACVFPTAPQNATTCAQGGVLGPLPGVMGAMMAVETVKHLTGAGETLRGRMMIYDALYADMRVMNIARAADCPVCQPTGET